MNRTTSLQVRLQKFRDVLSRWERKELSALEAGEIFGVQSGSSDVTGGATRRMGLQGSSTDGLARNRQPEELILSLRTV
jgi:hypothetical protein